MKTKNQELLEIFNKAFAQNGTGFILQQVSENIKWTAVGEFTIEGKEAFQKALESMDGDQPYELSIKNTHGKSAAVEGIMTSKADKHYAFCDVYKFSEFKNPKISEMTSYVLEL
jgi:hypothetical protein